MIDVYRQALVPHTAADMYELVADVDAYPEFLPWCGSASVKVLSSEEVEASIEIVRGRIRKTFTTRNSMRRYDAIEMRLVEGPFRELEGQWRFDALGDLGCKVSLEMHFEFSNALTRMVIGAAFSEIANSLVDAFCRRAANVYGSA